LVIEPVKLTVQTKITYNAPKSKTVIRDVLTDIDGLTFEVAWKNRQLVKFDEIEAYSLEIHDIIKNKTASNRPKDKLDLVQLKELLDSQLS